MKISARVSPSDVKGLIAFQEEHKPKQAIIVCLADAPRKMIINNTEIIDVLPWKVFLSNLWDGTVI